MKIPKWNYTGDVNMLDYGGKNFRCVGNRQFQFVELVNMDEACGRDNAGQPFRAFGANWHGVNVGDNDILRVKKTKH